MTSQAQSLLSRAQLALRWGCSIKTIDRLKRLGRLPWLNISGKDGKRPMIRFPLSGIQEFEETTQRADGAEND